MKNRLIPILSMSLIDDSQWQFVTARRWFMGNTCKTNVLVESNIDVLRVSFLDFLTTITMIQRKANSDMPIVNWWWLVIYKLVSWFALLLSLHASIGAFCSTTKHCSALQIVFNQEFSPHSYKVLAGCMSNTCVTNQWRSWDGNLGGAN
jgi:hypothetical protein